MRLWALVIVAVVPLLVACGGGSKRPKVLAKAGTTTTVAPGDPTATTTTIPGSPASPGATQPGSKPGQAPNGGPAGGGNGAAGGPTTTAIAQPGPPQPTTGQIDRTCVHKGAVTEPQGLTVHMTTNSAVGYETVYSDNSTEVNNKSYKAGYGYGKSGPDGVYRATWVVPGTAPLGKATVYVLTTADKPPLQLPFDIVPVGAKCP